MLKMNPTGLIHAKIGGYGIGTAPKNGLNEIDRHKNAPHEIRKNNASKLRLCDDARSHEHDRTISLTIFQILMK